ncbi:MAG: hypothetical protein D6806_18715 [Deltaproteobacteria bacterium]|nr:MAG: hypothetical protein D6806_18715 [Deltaproteobacteria bacterium]
MRRWSICIFAWALLVAGCSSGGGQPDAGIDADGGAGDEGPTICSSIADCPLHNLCIDGICQAGSSCTSDGDCQSGYVCFLSKEVCVPENPCSGDGDCSAPTPRCLDGFCVACLDDNDCSSGMECSPDHECVLPGPDCTGDNDCSAPTPHCDTAAGKCVECVTDGHCSGQVCEPSSKRCVDCYQNTHCGGDTPYCLVEQHLCVGCRDDGDCPGNQRCSQAHVCTDVVCTSDADCSGTVSTPRCNTATGDCVQCTSHDHCSSFQWCRNFTCQSGCQTDQECVDKQGAGYHCNSSTGQCYYAECTSDSDCTSQDKPHCLTQQNPANNRCVECTDDTHCNEFFYCRPTDHVCSPQPCYQYPDPDAKCREVNSCYICDYSSGNCTPPTDQSGFSCTYPNGPECCPGYRCNTLGHCTIDLNCSASDPVCPEGYECNTSYNQCEWKSCCQPPCGSGEFCNADCQCESGCHGSGEMCDPFVGNCCQGLICNPFWPFCTGG